MALSPFSSTSTMFLLLGLTDDEFCLPDTRLVELPTYLDIHLRSLGYTKIAFYHPLTGVRERGDAVAPTSSPSAPAAAPAAASGGTESVGAALVAGPLGQVDLRPEPGRPRPRPSQRDFSRMPETELPGYIDTLLERGASRAFVFEDFEGLMDVRPAALSPLWQVLRSVHRRSTGREKIIFTSISQRIESLTRDDENRHFLHSFRDYFFLNADCVAPSVILVEPPGPDEILNFQRRVRLRKHLPTDFTALSRRCQKIAGGLREQSAPDSRKLKNNKRTLEKQDWLAGDQTPSALTRLDALPGREAVAARIGQDIRHVQGLYEEKARESERPEAGEGHSPVAAVGRLLDQRGESIPQVNLSYALAGKPGTGKTIIARLIAEAFKEAGVLPSGHFIECSVESLVGQYVGETTLKTNTLLRRALGGVLFIDEVQGFERDNQFHREAIRAILKYVEDYRGRLSVIVATYPDKLTEFLAIDQGLARRFSQIIQLADYDAAACRQIFEYMCAESGVEIDASLLDKLEGFFDAWINDRRPSSEFSNAGSVRNLLGGMDRRRSERNGRNSPLQVQDVPEDYRDYLERAARRVGSEDERIEHALAELNALTGLSGVKRAIGRIVNGIRAARVRGEDAADIVPGHYSFEGNPGTGKTTVARLFGNVLRELDVLSSGHVVEVTRGDLVAQYSGHTAPLVQRRADDARGGILFIDEAHNLIQGENDSFGREAIGELTAILENRRSSLCVIVAGYSGPMERLFAQDAGWRSRFRGRIRFADYSVSEMEEILRSMCRERRWSLHADLGDSLEGILAKLRNSQGGEFANGRSIRKLLDDLQAGLDERVVAGRARDPCELRPEDVPSELRASW